MFGVDWTKARLEYNTRPKGKWTQPNKNIRHSKRKESEKNTMDVYYYETEGEKYYYQRWLIYQVPLVLFAIAIFIGRVLHREHLRIHNNGLF